jgi:hypothetical protein
VLVGVIIGVVISRSLTGQLGGEPSYAAHVAGASPRRPDGAGSDPRQ